MNQTRKKEEIQHRQHINSIKNKCQMALNKKKKKTPKKITPFFSHCISDQRTTKEHKLINTVFLYNGKK